MRYISTRQTGGQTVSFEHALLQGLARDGGLYIPERWPALDNDALAALRGRPYAEVAAAVMAEFTGRAFSRKQLAAIAAESYAGFDHPATAPLVQLGPDQWLLELFHGPTLAFKDFALQMVARLLDAVLAKRGRTATILAATSGDTGAAAIEAFRGREALSVVVLHPAGRVSEMQRRQMTTAAEPNVHNVAIAGTFDDCQALVKALFADLALRDEDRARSGQLDQLGPCRGADRLLRLCALALGAPGRAVSFTVPTGNFGNVYAGYAARQMGVPIERLMVATNRNDILARFFETGLYRKGTVHRTLSPSMDIQVASNFERLLADLSGRDGDAVCALMAELAEHGEFTLRGARLAQAKAAFAAARADDDACLATIADVWRESGRMIDPHSAAGVHAARLHGAGAAPMVSLATAHAAKFPDAIERAIGVSPGPAAQACGARGEARTGDGAARGCGPAHALHPRPGPRAAAGVRGVSVQITPLANGLRVVSDPVDHVETASVGLWVDVGARCETEETNGLSHLLEHMAFKGTERRSARDIAEEIEAVGGHLNAYTSRETTAYYAKVMKEDVPLALDLLADILQHSTFDEEELERERAVVIQEIAQVNDTPDDLVFDRFQETAYPDQPIGRTILGPPERVGSYSREALAAYMGAHYRAARMVLVGSGRVDHDALVAAAEAAFTALPEGPVPAPAAAVYSGGDCRIARDLEQAHLLVGFDGLAYDDDDFYALQVMSTLLGGGMSSRLFQEIRERRGLAYSVFTFASSYADGGIFGVYAGAGEDELAELIPVMADELVNACATVGDEEVARARAQLKAGLLMSLESTQARAERLGRHILLFGRPLTIAELIERVDAVDREAVQRTACRILQGCRPTVAALGPIARLEGHDSIAARFA